MTVNGMHFSWDKAGPFSTKILNHKFGGKAALMYKLDVYTHKAKISWLNRPFPTRNNDQPVLRKGGLKEAVEEKQR